MQDEPEGQEPEETPDEGSQEQTAPDPNKELERLRRENQKLRASRRQETAKRLATQFPEDKETPGLHDAMAELLQMVPEDRMESMATKLLETFPKSQGQPAEAQEPPSEPPEKDAAAAMDRGEETGQPARTPDPEAELLKAVEGAGSAQELIQIQQRARAARQESG